MPVLLQVIFTVNCSAIWRFNDLILAPVYLNIVDGRWHSPVQLFSYLSLQRMSWGAKIWSRKHTCLCVTSRWGVGLVRLVPVLVPGETQGTISHRAAVHTELIIISFLNTLCLALPLYCLQAQTELLKSVK